MVLRAGYEPATYGYSALFLVLLAGGIWMGKKLRCKPRETKGTRPDKDEIELRQIRTTSQLEAARRPDNRATGPRRPDDADQTQRDFIIGANNLAFNFD
ncbi:hypothetical protein JYU34_014590 [Plutella xylostella]|uniref:Uncharacterized protein n=1 Tax=Plutella xylostella TaxID=51655 RepID=A0ABQ7QCC4_PLUXY|nr:hypothetical protein JYU34_014590 [Plutella xylostella]